MCQHSWYDKNRRHYGPKPNTRRARGLPNRNKGIKVGPTVYKQPSNLPEVDVDMNVNVAPIPRTIKGMKKHAKIYNWYVQHYDKYPDKDLCIRETADKFGLSVRTVYRAIAACKYILATSAEE